MTLGMAIVTQPPPHISGLTVPRMHHKGSKLWSSRNLPGRNNFSCINIKHNSVCYSNTSPWEPAPITYATDSDETLPKETPNIFETMNSLSEPAQISTTSTENQVDTSNQPAVQLQYLKWPLWLLGPALLLATGIVPTLWLPISSVFLGPNIASLLSLTGLDCIFNLGASLFLLMADSTARNNTESINSKPPFSYRFWNMAANLTGFIVPMLMLFASEKGFFQPQLPFISYLVLLGPYFLLLSVQMLTEMLTWHWRSPVWLVTPVVYESYRLLQLMRGLKLGVEVGAPSWMVHTIRGLVCGWVLVLGVQLMRVAWYAGFTARGFKPQTAASGSE